ncbi:PRC-barrel domain-containing protein [Methylocapsa palsarum]|uniref:PRC-barrel domain-containing protein n=1 Tax=Methylocapsa palsarum TaxID=1612308 RepID=A0A1I3XCP3_9HYPH|nr:PRC-barrel domain-containing protein [Methylocapsa palsarum]SFK17274.1 PRC-barrel domain-containing protein [Methylocapsa palsarum]
MEKTSLPEDQNAAEPVTVGKIEGADVYSLDGEPIGAIESLMIDKRSGKIAYAVMSFGGFFGIGEEFFPIPWEKLHYDSDHDAFKIDINKDDLQNAPKYRDEAAYDWSRAEGRKIHEHYGLPFLL